MTKESTFKVHWLAALVIGLVAFNFGKQQRDYEQRIIPAQELAVIIGDSDISYAKHRGWQLSVRSPYENSIIEYDLHPDTLDTMIFLSVDYESLHFNAEVRE